MLRNLHHPLILLALAFCIASAAAQQLPAPKILRTPAPQLSPDASITLPPMKDPATIDQIHEYLRLSGEMDSYRVRWIAAVDKERSKGVFQSWPESFWTALKAEMGKTDLMPMFIIWYQHGISRDLMQEVLNTYHTVGATLFKISPASFKLAAAQQAMTADVDKLRLAKTLEVNQKVYAVYKPQIQAASARYQAQHPDSVGK